jgi:hypothetical protein
MNINDNIHELFIQASCDNNIIHINSEHAKILGAKNKIIHGVHQLIIVFNILKIEEQQISNYRAHFLKPISVNEEFEIGISRENSHINVNIFNEINDFTKIVIDLIEPTSTNEITKLDRSLIEANYKKMDDVDVSVRFNLNHISKIYPDLFSYISRKFVFNLLTISYYFGVHLETDNLMFVSLNIKLIKGINSDKLVKTKSLNNAELHHLYDGSLVFESIGKKIIFSISRESLVQNDFNLGRYKNQKALVLGGTGSLGKALIKLLIRDQSEIHATYSDLEKLKFGNPIEYNKISFWKYTVNEDLLPDIDGITHLYYFITPRIFSSNKRDFSDGIYQEFLDIYLVNLLKVYEKYRNTNLVMVFTPSTTAIEEKIFNLKEYIQAKNEMERKLTNMNFEIGREIFQFPRLPAFDSSQTINMPLYMRKDPLEIVHEFIVPPV